MSRRTYSQKLKPTITIPIFINITITIPITTTITTTITITITSKHANSRGSRLAWARSLEMCPKPTPCPSNSFWVAVKELKLSYHIAETLSFTIYTHYGKLD